MRSSSDWFAKSLPASAGVALAVTALATASFSIIAFVLEKGLDPTIDTLLWFGAIMLGYFPGNLAVALMYARGLIRSKEGATVNEIPPAPVMAFSFMVISGVVGAVFYNVFIQRPGVEDWTDFIIAICTFFMALLSAAYWGIGEIFLARILDRTAYHRCHWVRPILSIPRNHVSFFSPEYAP